ncbi:MAG TPA: hypothetical protein VKU39_11980 [Streptosporangiaceae bacterium]|nr:hypothetical protein [Streptosporangiaceae bacterium]
MNLASAAASQVVTLLTTDAWERIRSALTSWWRHGRPDQADAIGADLARARDQMVTAADENGQTAQLLRAEWQSRIWRLLEADPELAGPLRALLADASANAGVSISAQSTVTMRARVTGGGSVYQAGRDQTINTRPGE